MSRPSDAGRVDAVSADDGENEVKEQLHRADSEQRREIEESLAGELAGVGDLAFAYTYGSYADMEPFHDIDVGVYLKDVQREETQRALALSEQLSNRVGKPVDVRILNFAPVSFLFHVLRGKLIVCRDDDLLSDVIEHTVSRYLDIAPLIRHATREAFTV